MGTFDLIVVLVDLKSGTLEAKQDHKEILLLIDAISSDLLIG